jgi:hypothetical protein
MNANITIRPNVFIRSSTELSKDSNFLQQVRGRNALLTVLRRISPSLDLQSAARTYLSQRQVAELAWDVPCADCGEFPEGAVKRNSKFEIEFRCPKQRCPSRHLIGRTIPLDPELVEQLMKSFGEGITQLAAVALAGYQKSTNAQFAPATSRRPYTIGLTSSQNYFFSDKDIETALRQLVQEKHR